MLTHVQLFLTPWTLACQVPLSMGFLSKNTGVPIGLPIRPPGHLTNPGIKPASIKSPALASKSFTTSTTWEAHYHCWKIGVLTSHIFCNGSQHLGQTPVHEPYPGRASGSSSGYQVTKTISECQYHCLLSLATEIYWYKNPTDFWLFVLLSLI